MEETYSTRFENGHVRFEANREASDLAALRISAKLLSLARVVHSGTGGGG